MADFVPEVPTRTPMFDGPDARKLGVISRTWNLFFQACRNPLLRVGDPLAAASIIYPKGSVFHVTGAGAIDTITTTEWLQVGQAIVLIPDGAFTWTTAGNIALAGTAVVGQALSMVWDGVLFYPSYS